MSLTIDNPVEVLESLKALINNMPTRIEPADGQRTRHIQKEEIIGGINDH